MMSNKMTWEAETKELSYERKFYLIRLWSNFASNQ